MKKLGFSFPLVHYDKDEQIDVSEAWSLDEKRNVQVTSSVGYVPLEKRVSAMIKAGITLEDMKDEFYCIDDDVDDDLDLVQDYDSKIELMRSCKERSERLSESFASKKQASVHEKENSVENVSEDSSGDNIATEDSSEVNASKEK